MAAKNGRREERRVVGRFHAGVNGLYEAPERLRSPFPEIPGRDLLESISGYQYIGAPGDHPTTASAAV
jgi:hypothetical protein